MEKNKEYQPLTIPRLSWNKNTLTDSYGELTVQPLEPGFGVTMGNALRRIMLGAVEGASVTSVIIKGVNNEFSPMAGVVEDTMQVILNIKQIVVRNKLGIPGKMRLRVSGEATATVGNIEADDHIELVNKDHVLAHVAPEGLLEIEFFVENGRGYVPVQWAHKTPYCEDGRIYLDAMFSPVNRVAFEVEKTRVGEHIDYDKLILTVYTDGSEHPTDVLHYAVSVLRSQLEYFLSVKVEIPFNEISVAAPATAHVQHVEETADVREEKEHVDILMKPIDDLELPVRAHNCLISAGVMTVRDLVSLKEEDMLKIKNFGRKSLTEVRESLEAQGLSLGMDVNTDKRTE